MNKLQIVYKDYVRCQVFGLTIEDRNKAYDHFSLFVPNARFTPKYKLGVWDGYDHYFTLTGLFYVNLLPELFEIIDMSKYQVERIYPDNLIQEPVFDMIDETYLEDRCWPKGHRLEGQPVQIYEHQVDIVNACLSNPRCIVDAATGCHGIGTKILMYNGTWKNVEDIIVGDVVMGDDGTPRNVLSLHRGKDEMYEITPTKSKPFIVNGGHILPVICNNKRKQDYMKVTNISVKDYMKQSNVYKHTHKIFNNKTQIEFNNKKDYIISPYIMGVYLGDGTTRGCGSLVITTMDDEIVKELKKESIKNNLKLVEHSDKRGSKAKSYSFNIINHNDKNIMKEELKRYNVFGKRSIDKFIPNEYLYGSINDRLELLAGLLDTDGYYGHGNRNYFEYCTNSKHLCEGVKYICGSLGLKTYIKEKHIKKYPNNVYYRVIICGNINIIPTRIKRKQVINKHPNKDCRHSSISIKYLGVGEYYGFECDGNHLYIMEDWWVQHNSGKSVVAMMLALEVSKHGRFILIEPSKDLTLQTAQVFRDLGVECGVCGCGFRELDKKITICTWQTIDSLERRKSGGKKDGKQIITKEQSELSQEELQQLVSGTVGVVFDEAHQMKSYNCKKICESTFKDVPLRWGLTGTIPKQKVDKYCIVCGIGHVAHTLGSKELQDKGILAKCDISCIKLIDDSEFRFFADELEYLSTNVDRLNFIGTLIHNIVQSQGNTLVLVNRIKCGEYLESVIKQLGSDCIFLDGSVKSKDRFREYESIKTENNKCIIATSQIAATGLSIDRLFNVVLLDYGKSFVKSIQSIGRGLRLGRDKDHCNIFDIFSTTRFSKKHFNDRIHYYNSKEFNFKVLEVEKWK